MCFVLRWNEYLVHTKMRKGLEEPMDRVIVKIIHDAGLPVFGACRFDPADLKISCRAVSRVPECAKTVLVFGFPYLLPLYGAGRNLSRYACVPDYHLVARRTLDELIVQFLQRFPNEQFAAFADISPFDEVLIAAKAGLGVVGRNTLLIHPVYGSWLFLGEIVTTLDMAVQDSPVRGCIGCGKCEQACPGKALCDGHLKEGRCVSFLTQKKGELSLEEQQLVSAVGLVWGCDRCQTICPMNQNARINPFPPLAQNIVESVTAENAGRLCKERAFGFRGAKVIRRNLGILEEKGGNTTGGSIQ